MRTSTTKGIICKIIDCVDCGHCADLHGIQKGDQKELTKVRKQELVLVKKWIVG